VSPAFVLVHLALVVGAAFLIGVRAFGDVHPAATADEDTAQLHRLAKSVSIGLVVMMVLVVVGLDLGLFRIASAIQ
jgi:hypothetical protein